MGLKPQHRHSTNYAVVKKYACTHIIQLHRIIIHTVQSALSLISGSHLLGESSFRKRGGNKIGFKKAQYSGVRVLALSDFKLLVEMPNR